MHWTIKLVRQPTASFSHFTYFKFDHHLIYKALLTQVAMMPVYQRDQKICLESVHTSSKINAHQRKS